MDLRANATLSQKYAEEMAVLGESVKPFLDEPWIASTDMGNVSYTVPSFHGSFVIPTPPDSVLHHPSFAAAAATGEAHNAAIKSAKGMAMLAWRVLTDETVAAGARADFENPDA